MLKSKIISSLDKCFLDSSYEEFNEIDRINIYRNTDGAFQLLPSDLEESDMARTYFKVKAEGDIADKVSFRTVESVPNYLPFQQTPKRAAELDPGYVRTTAGLYPDLLLPIQHGDWFSAIKCQHRTLWVDVKNDGIPAGEHKLKIMLCDMDGNKVTENEITVNVINAELPEQEEKPTVLVSDTNATTVQAVDGLWYATENLKVATSGGTKYLTGAQAGDYALYQINVQKTGYYDIAPIIAAVNESSGGLMLELYVEVDGNRVAEYRATATDTWTSFTEQAAVSVKLTEGVHKLRFVFDGVANFSGIKFTPSSRVEGDINGDEAVDANDLSALRQIILSGGGDATICDLTGDSEIDICDLVELRNIITKKS